MEPGASVWCRDKDGDEAWILAEVVQRKAHELTLRPADGRPVLTRGVESQDAASGETKFDGVELANTPLSQEEKEEGRDNDLITLPHLHEPAILHSLSDRFFRGKIYTWTGPVLIAVNPFQRLSLYTNEILEQYRRDGLLRAQGMQAGKTLEPHVFAVADRSYRQMMGEARKSQSILISGESGAGKTESTKIVMLYLTTLGAGGDDVATDGGDGELSIMEKVLQSNPILEAFGNARTLRNDNSSRFGKFIELGFNRAGHLKGAKVQTYLLEKVRLAFHAAGERNYHIFYQLLRGCKDEEHAKYEFHEGITGGLDLPNFFHYTGQGGAPHLREFTDESGYEYTKKAMRRLGWSEETIEQVFGVIAGLLHLGQITFNSVEMDGLETAEIADEKILQYSARLLGVDLDRCRLALTERIIVARDQEIKTQLTPERAIDARDALAKTIYGSLFLWIVDQVNQSIGWKDNYEIKSSCGVLDIFGFECFAVNSFEQLCINYTNEALQQQFNQFIFKLEQAEYDAEKIEWAFIEFPDNQDCLDTIQAPKVGILSMLDDECRLPKGSDRNWANRMYDQWVPGKDRVVSENTRFHATNIQKAKAIFCVRHFAGVVEYRAETSFMEKNKDEIPLTAVQMFETAPSQLIKDTYAVQTRENLGREADSSGKQAKQKTVGQQFKEQLTSLIDNVQQTDPHYIRCIKPNDAAKPLLLIRKRTTEQLRYGGVLEAVRVARAGYPVRMYHEAFYKRYRMLLPTVPENELPWAFDEDKAQYLCVRLVEVALEAGRKHQEATEEGPLSPHESGITRSEKIRRLRTLQPIPMVFPKTDVQLGLTKVFMRKHPHDCLEAHRVFHQHTSATVIQSWARCLSSQRQYYIIQDAVLNIQRTYRGSKGRERWRRLRQGAAGDLLTNHFRMVIKWRAYNRARRGAITLQARFRGRNVRKILAAARIQQYYRKYSAAKLYRMLKSAVIALQCALRRRMAIKVLTELKKEQKDVGKLKTANVKLKEEMATLRAMLNAQAKESAAGAAHMKELKEKEVRIAELERRISEIEKELEEAKATVRQLESDLQRQTDSNERDKSELQQLRAPRRQGKRTPDSPPIHRRMPSATGADVNMEGQPDNYISPALLHEHMSKVARLEEELEEERTLRLEADGEIIRLRAAINGVNLDSEDVKALSAPQRSSTASSTVSDAGSVTDAEEDGKRDDPEFTGREEKEMDGRSPEVQTRLDKLGIKEEREPRPSMLAKIGADFIPMIRRGLAGNLDQEVDDALAVGWKVEIRSRKEREEALRDEVHRFEIKMKKFAHSLEEGVDIVLWQLNKGAPETGGEADEFSLKATSVTMKMHRRGDLFVQTVLTFMLRGGYLSKAMGRNRHVDKTALEPLSLHDILEVRAGCSGYDHTELPSASGKTNKSSSKSKSSSASENEQTSLFMTIKATPTPVASTRSYIFRFKSRSARNDTLNGLRSILADMQISEGVSISGLHNENGSDIDDSDREDIMVPLSAVHTALNREREQYDRILLMLLQGSDDLKEKEDELLNLRSKLRSVVAESREKDRVQANDSKLIMQLSKKLETLLMDNEDLRDQNDRLNTRLVSVESEKMNLLANR